MNEFSEVTKRFSNCRMNWIGRVICRISASQLSVCQGRWSSGASPSASARSRRRRRSILMSPEPDAAKPADRLLPIYVGVDGSLKRDSSAIVAVAFDQRSQRVRLVFHRVFQPSPSEPLDFELSIVDRAGAARKLDWRQTEAWADLETGRSLFATNSVGRSLRSVAIRAP